MPFTYSTKTLPDGHKFFYSDSGPVPDSTTYTTVVIIHGSAFTGHGFEKMHDAGLKQNMRTIIINRPGYSGSSLYSDAEVDDAANGRQIFLDRFQDQLAHFLHFIITDLGIPKADKATKIGGLAVMGWSFGVIHLLTLLGNPDVISKDIYEVIEPQLNNLIIYESPHVCIGLEVPDELNNYDVWHQKGKTEAEMYQDFLTWVSSYYDHRNPEAMTVEDLDLRIRTDVCTVERMTPAELEKAFDSPSAVRSDFPMLGPPMLATLVKQAERALFNRELASKLFPNIRLSYITGIRTQWHVICGKVLLKKKISENTSDARPIKFIEVENANHFMHYDAPDALVAAATQLIHT